MYIYTLSIHIYMYNVIMIFTDDLGKKTLIDEIKKKSDNNDKKNKDVISNEEEKDVVMEDNEEEDRIMDDSVNITMEEEPTVDNEPKTDGMCWY